MKTEIVRRIDELGRIVLPAEIRDALGWDAESKISITRQGTRVVMQPFRGSCFVCGKENDIRPIHGKFICKMCIDEINSES